MSSLPSQPPLRLAPLKTTSSLHDLMIEEEHFAFAEKDEQGNVQYFHGLKHFLLFQKADLPPIYICDNHHHALFFRYLEYLKTKKICTLLHLDQHSDMNENPHLLPSSILHQDQSALVSQFVKQYCTVGNFIQPALKSWLIAKVHPLITTYSLQHLEMPREPYILDIDLDFRAPETGNQIESHLALLHSLIQNAESVTIATSPFFLDQHLAIEMVGKLVP